MDGWHLYTEDWDPAYGTPDPFDLDAADEVVAVEAGPLLVPPLQAVTPGPLCFVDGRRRAELALWAERPGTGARVPGLAGAYAVGAVTVRPGGQARFAGVRVGRVALWGCGHEAELVAPSGHRWASTPTAATEPAQLLARLQELMRRAEGDLAVEAAAAGWDVVLDGPLNRIRSLAGSVAGYVKTHRRQLLPPDDHAAVPGLAVGGRTRLHAAGADRYTCYVRVGHPGPGGSPWAGVARLEFAASVGLDAAVHRAGRLAALLPRFAGVPHRDGRAPVNLTPVRNLEAHLSRVLGRVEHATRAARDAVVGRRTA